MKKIILKWRGLSVQTKSSLIYTISNIITKGVTFISIPIFTRLMTASEIGVGTTYMSWQAILYAIATLSITSGSLNIAMMHYKDERDRYQSAVLILSTISAMIITVIYLIFSGKLNRIMSLTSPLVGVMLLSFFLMPAMDIWLIRQRYEYNYKSTALISIISSSLSIIVAIVFVLFTKNIGIEKLGTVRVVSQNIVVFLFCIIFYILILYKGRCLYSKEYWKFALTLSIPLIFHALSKQVMDVSDRIMISNMCGEAEAGIYGTIYSISTMVLVLWSAINNSIIPFLFEKIKSKEYSQIRKMINPILSFFAVVALLLTVIAPDIIRIILPKEFYSAIYIIPALAAGIYLTALYNLFSNVLLYYKKTNYIMIATSVAALINITINYFFIPKFGYYIAAYTTLLSYIILSIMQYIMMKIISKENIFDIKFILIISFMTVLLNLSCTILYINNTVRYITLIVLICVSVFFRKNIFYFFKNLKNNQVNKN